MSDTKGAPSKKGAPSQTAAKTAANTASLDGNRAIWLRGFWMLLLLILFSIARFVLIAVAVLQFGWMLFTRKANDRITDFGSSLGNWMAITARYLAGASEEKPFPWTAWR